MLPRGELSSLYYPKLQKETEALFRLFYYAKDFDTFYKTALWARVFMNEMQFGEALYTAVMLREDTKFLQLPPPYEIYPYGFFNSEVLEKAHHAKLFGKLGKFQSHLLFLIETNAGRVLHREFLHKLKETKSSDFVNFTCRLSI